MRLAAQFSRGAALFRIAMFPGLFPSDASKAGISPLRLVCAFQGLAARATLGLLVFSVANLLLAHPATVTNDWLPIDPADLAMKSNPVNPGSHAMILYSETVIDEATVSVSLYERIKIFDEEGKKFASVEAPVPSKFHLLEDLRARTIHSDGSIVNFVGSTVRKRKISITARALVECFELPDVTPGSIVEYKYRFQPHLEPEPATTLSPHFPKTVLELLFTRPQNFYWSANGELFQRNSRYIVHLRQPGWLVRDLSGGWKPELRAENLPVGAQVSLKDGTWTYEAANVPASEDLPYAPPMRERQAHIEVYFPAYKPTPEKEFWSQFAGMMKEQEDAFGASRKLIRHVMEETVRAGDSTEVKARKLYARAQAIRNEDFEAAPHEVEKASPENLRQTAEEVLRAGTGSSRDINAVFVELALEAGLDAGTAYVSPRDVQKFDPTRQDRGQLIGSTLAWVQLEHGNIALDPGTPFCPYGLLPWPKTSAGGLLLRKKGSLSFSSRALGVRESGIERDTRLQLTPEGRLQGRMEIGFFGEASLELRLLAIGKNEEDRGQLLASRIREWVPEGTQIGPVAAAGWDTTEDPLRARVELWFPASVSPDGKISLPVFLSGAGTKNPFENPSRKEIVQFPYPFREIDQVAIAFSAGGGVEQLPTRSGHSLEVEGMRLIAPDEDAPDQLRKRVPGKVTLANYQVWAEDHGTWVLVRRELDSQIREITPENYPKLRDFYSQVRQSDLRSVVLRTGKAVAAQP